MTTNRYKHCLFYSLLCLLFLQFITAQPTTFNTHIDVNENSDSGRDILQLADSSFILISQSACYSSQTFAGHVGCVVVAKTNRYGEVLWKREYKNPAYIYHAAGIVAATDGGFLIGSEADIPNKGLQKYLMKISSEGDSLWLKHYGEFIDEDLISAYTGTPDGHLLLLGEIGKFGQNDSWDICLTKLDQEGNPIWQKRYGGEGLEDGSDIAIDNDGGYLIGGASRSFSEDGTPRAYLIKTDTAGNELWNKVYEYCDASSTRTYIETLPNHSGYLKSCAIDTVYASGRNNTIAAIHRLDLDFKNVWTYYIEPEEIHYIKGGRPFPMKDGSIWIVGADETPIEEGGETSYTGWIAKLSAEGELLWERQYFPENKGLLPRLTDLVETHDGGVALTGLYSYRENGITRNDIWLLKLDQDGCIESGCDDDYLILGDTVVGIEDVENGEVVFEVYPNPNSGQANFHIQKDLLLKGNTQVQILDINGRLLQEYNCPKNNKVLSINTQSLENGLYICTLISKGQIIAYTKMSVIK
ncbi:MAG: T9SS type A sorting domain-containing protein [Chitinophagales bacterium]